jgi:hypothetical protein
MPSTGTAAEEVVLPAVRPVRQAAVHRAAEVQALGHHRQVAARAAIAFVRQAVALFSTQAMARGSDLQLAALAGLV